MAGLPQHCVFKFESNMAAILLVLLRLIMKEIPGEKYRLHTECLYLAVCISSPAIRVNANSPEDMGVGIQGSVEIGWGNA